MRCFRFFSAAFFLNLFMLLSPSARAGLTEVNVLDAAGLQASLSAAEIDANDTVITLAPGVYTTSAGGGTFTYDSSLTKSLTLQGAGRGQTVLDGEGGTRVLFVNHLGGVATVTLSKMTIRNGFNDQTFERGAGLLASGENIDIIVEDAEFADNLNEVGTGGGFFIETLTGRVRLNRNLVTGNKALGIFSNGGGGFIYAGVRINVLNNIFYKNEAEQEGGGMEAENSIISFVNNTFLENTAGTQGGGFFIDVFDVGSSGNVYNNIAFGNVANGGPEAGADIFLDNADLLSVPGNVFHNIFSQACYFGGCDPASTEGISAGDNDSRDPLIADPLAGDFSLSLGSPALDAGDPAPPIDLPTPDFAGTLRPFGPAPDLGALEALPRFQLSANSVDFGEIVAGGSSSQEITLQNLGVAVLTVTTATLGGSSAFTLDFVGGSAPCGPLPFTIAGGTSCKMSVGFTADVAGPYAATIELVSDDPQAPSMILSLAGTIVPSTNGGSASGGCVFIQGADPSGGGTWIAWLAACLAFMAAKSWRLPRRTPGFIV